MTPNESLVKSEQISNLLPSINVESLIKYFPIDEIHKYDLEHKRRNRIFTTTNTLLTMLLTALSVDKSLSSSVLTFSEIHKWNYDYYLLEKKRLEEERSKEKRKRGRPVKDLLPIPKSKKKEISLNTSAYSQARDRIDLGIIKKVFERTTIDINNKQRMWKGHPIFVTDGTYISLQDTAEFRKEYSSGTEYAKSLPYPKAILQVIIQQGTGKIQGMVKSPWNCSEIKLFAEMIETLPSGGIVIADTLYNSYHLFNNMIDKGVSFIIPDKKRKSFKIIREISAKENIIELKPNKSPKWFKGEASKTMQLRRIEWSLEDSEKGTMVLLTDLLDEGKYPSSEIIGHYLTRWDIEICFREIKKIMEIDILRGKTEEMIQKELYIALSAYNLIREIISDSTQEGTFPPYEDFFQKVYQGDKKLLVDKVGRVYVRWSTGRYGVFERQIKEVDKHTPSKSTL